MPFGTLLMASALLAKAELMLGPSDYPVEALRSKRSGAAIIDAWVDPKGRIVRCEVAKMFGDATLASQMCSLLKSRKHQAATDGMGHPTYGWVLELNTMWIPDSKDGDQIGRMKWADTVPLTLDTMPAHAEGGPIKVVYQVGSDGQPVDCGAGKGEARADAVSAVCATLKPTFGIKSDKDDQPVTYVTQIQIDLKSRPPSVSPLTQ